MSDSKGKNLVFESPASMKRGTYPTEGPCLKVLGRPGKFQPKFPSHTGNVPPTSVEVLGLFSRTVVQTTLRPGLSLEPPKRCWNQ